MHTPCFPCNKKVLKLKELSNQENFNNTLTSIANDLMFYGLKKPFFWFLYFFHFLNTTMILIKLCFTLVERFRLACFFISGHAMILKNDLPTRIRN